MNTLENLTEFLDAIGYGEQPMAMFYTNREPKGGFSPEPAELLTVDKEQSGQIDWGAVFGDFSCVIGNIWRARRKSSLPWFSAERFGCPGGAFYLGFLKPQTDTIAHYVSTGIPGVFDGERYIDSPEHTHAFFQAIDPLPAAARCCVFKPLDQLETTEEPEVVMLFARPEVLVGLHTLAMFVTNDIKAVVTPFGAGCSHIVTWPRGYTTIGANSRRRWAAGTPPVASTTKLTS